MLQDFPHLLFEKDLLEDEDLSWRRMEFASLMNAYYCIVISKLNQGWKVRLMILLIIYSTTKVLLQDLVHSLCLLISLRIIRCRKIDLYTK
jgi:hypothetical protein